MVNPHDAHTTPTADAEPQTAPGKVLWHSAMSLDGFVADHGQGRTG